MFDGNFSHRNHRSRRTIRSRGRTYWSTGNRTKQPISLAGYYTGSLFPFLFFCCGLLSLFYYIYMYFFLLFIIIIFLFSRSFLFIRGGRAFPYVRRAEAARETQCFILFAHAAAAAASFQCGARTGFSFYRNHVVPPKKKKTATRTFRSNEFACTCSTAARLYA